MGFLVNNQTEAQRNLSICRIEDLNIPLFIIFLKFCHAILAFRGTKKYTVEDSNCSPDMVTTS